MRYKLKEFCIYFRQSSVSSLNDNNYTFSYNKPPISAERKRVLDYVIKYKICLVV